jgi:hypothetical protein
MSVAPYAENVGPGIGSRGDAISLDGSLEETVDKLVEWAIHFRVDAFVFWPASTGTEVVERLATEIAPRVQLRVRDAAPNG